MTGPSAEDSRRVQDPPLVDLRIGGMTCASCAARIEKRLNRMPGVVATVNYATEKARVSLPPDMPVEAAIATVVARHRSKAALNAFEITPADGYPQVGNRPNQDHSRPGE